jgi:hypothetical protein
MAQQPAEGQLQQVVAALLGIGRQRLQGIEVLLAQRRLAACAPGRQARALRRALAALVLAGQRPEASGK